MRKPYHWCPGMVAAREIYKLQKSTDLLIRKAPFQCVVLEPERVTYECRAQLSWLSRKLWNTSWLMSSTISTCAHCMAGVKPS
jgi:hypothetical protein